jgi:hypothetical protein
MIQIIIAIIIICLLIFMFLRKNNQQNFLTPDPADLYYTDGDRLAGKAFLGQGGVVGVDLAFPLLRSENKKDCPNRKLYINTKQPKKLYDPRPNSCKKTSYLTDPDDIAKITINRLEQPTTSYCGCQYCNDCAYVGGDSGNEIENFCPDFKGGSSCLMCGTENGQCAEVIKII